MNPPIERVAPWEWFPIEEVDEELERLALVDTAPTPAPAPAVPRRSSSPVRYGQRSQSYWQRQAAAELVEGALRREEAARMQRAREVAEALRCKHFYVEVGPGQARCRLCQHGVSFSALHPVTFAAVRS
ncbi:MAG TPA: hypothetical protein VNO55_31720 [Polyangia bacterium]|nr:hypothetical protein [Polyangia bacterium]